MDEKTGKNSKGRTKKEVILWWIYLLIGFVASVVIASMGYIFYVANHMVAVHTPLHCAAMEIRIEITTAHLWCEEIISGDQQESIDTVWGHLDEADWYAQAMLEGGEKPHWKCYPVDDAGVHRVVESIQAKLAEFRAITEERLAKPADSPVGSEIDQKYDAVFAELMNAAEQVEAEIKQMISHHLRNFHIVQTVLIFICLALTVLVGIVIGRFMRRQIRDELKLQAANQQLDTSNQQLRASEQQLRAANQQLLSSEQQLKAVNQHLRANEQQLRASNQQLRESEEGFRDFFENATIGFHIFGPDRIIARINEAELEMIGYKREEIVGKKTWADLIISEQRTEFKKHWQDIITKGKVRNLEYTLIHKDGHQIDVILNASSRFDKQGNLTRTRGSVLDITQRKQAEEALRAANQQLTANGQQLKAANQQLLSSEQQLKASNQQLIANEQQLRASNQQLLSSEQQLKASNQQLMSSEQQLKAANQQLIASQEEIQSLANFPSENSNPVLRIAKDGIVLYNNEAGVPLLTAWRTQMGRRLPDKWGKFAADVFGSGSSRETECDYDDHVLSLTFTPVVDLSYVNVYGLDITKRKRAEQQLKTSLEEKEVLLREIHHRVKNNLQIIVSLLSLQSEYVQDKQAVELFRESQFRVKSMALLHERLYETEDLAHINFSDYIRDLTNELLCSYGSDAMNIKLKINVKDVFPSVDVAVPCALIINELVSNCLKHAFPKGRAGEIRIEFDSDKQDNYTLLISDDGVGFAKDVDFPDGRTLGLQLVSTLAEQLQGSVVLDKSAGTSFKISFSKSQ